MSDKEMPDRPQPKDAIESGLMPVVSLPHGYDVKPVNNRYCYIIRSSETDIVAVRSGRTESEEKATEFAKQQGATETKVSRINDELTRINIIKSDTPCKVWIERHRIK